MKTRSSTHLLRLALSFVLAATAAPTFATPFSASFSGSASINSGTAERTRTFTDFVEPAATDAEPSTSIPGSDESSYSVESRALLQGDGTLEFGQIVSGTGTHAVDVSSRVNASLANDTGETRFGILDFEILSGSIVLEDYLSEASGTANGDSGARVELAIDVDGIGAVTGAASVSVKSGAILASPTIEAAASLLAGARVENDSGASGAAPAARFSWDTTTGVIDLGPIAPGQVIDVDFLLRTAVNSARACGESNCTSTGAAIFDPPGFGSIRTPSLRLLQVPFTSIVTPVTVPDIYAAVDLTTSSVIVAPSGPGFFDVPAPATQALLLFGITLTALRRRQRADGAGTRRSRRADH